MTTQEFAIFVWFFLFGLPGFIALLVIVYYLFKD